jgi:hypothetical protein
MTIETFPHLEELGKIKGVSDFLGSFPASHSPMLSLTCGAELEGS